MKCLYKIKTNVTKWHNSLFKLNSKLKMGPQTQKFKFIHLFLRPPNYQILKIIFYICIIALVTPLAHSATTQCYWVRMQWSSISTMLWCETGGPSPMNSICNLIPSLSKKVCLSFNKIECFAYELRFSINTISIWKGIKEKHEMEQAASTYCIFQLICPINSLDT